MKAVGLLSLRVGSATAPVRLRSVFYALPHVNGRKLRRSTSLGGMETQIDATLQSITRWFTLPEQYPVVISLLCQIQ